MSTYEHIIKQALPVRKGEKKGVKDIQQASSLEGATETTLLAEKEASTKPVHFPLWFTRDAETEPGNALRTAGKVGMAPPLHSTPQQALLLHLHSLALANTANSR